MSERPVEPKTDAMRAANPEPASGDRFADDALAGLLAEPKALPAKYLYDERGSALFDEICELEAYYPTRTEIGILERALPEIADRLGTGEVVIEPGAGSGQKTVMLIEALDDPAAIVPIDISPDFIDAACAALRERFPGVAVEGVVADFTGDVRLPEAAHDEDRRLVFFPGSTIGNFDTAERAALLASFARMAGHGGRLLLGYDLVKERSVLLRAYDDEDGVTAAFNRNLLERMNREAGASFDPDRFRHESRWNEAESRIEMHLVSTGAQIVEIEGEPIRFEAGESIHTENSHKFERDAMLAELASHGFAEEATWTDDREYFAVSLLRHDG